MRNAKKELLTDVKSNKIKCASIRFYKEDEEVQQITLKVGHTEEELNGFLESLDFTYYNSDSNLCGTVWLEDGSWLSRDGYDVDWWNHIVIPNIPFECIG